MKIIRLFMTIAVFAATVFSLSAQEPMREGENRALEPLREGNNVEISSVSIRTVEGDPSRMSVRVAGFELLVDNGDRRNWYGNDEFCTEEISTYEDGHLKHKHKKRISRYYGGRIGTLEIGLGGFRATPSAYAAYPASEAGFMDLNMGKSIHIAVNIFTFSSALTRDNTLGVTAAIGLSTSNYTFETPTAFVKAEGMIHPINIDHLKKAKLNTFAIHFPLALEVNPSRDFFFSVGGYADLVVGSHMKWKSPKEKLHGPYTNFLQAGLSARIGFRNAYAFANYGMVDMFRGGHGPVVNPYTFGIGMGF